ncbi:hypothetical protein VB735_31460 [Halotia wernerae UHCC 0503]|nr:hypothetical protein [Halotia wernerae UHCC 0503]
MLKRRGTGILRQALASPLLCESLRQRQAWQLTLPDATRTSKSAEPPNAVAPQVKQLPSLGIGDSSHAQKLHPASGVEFFMQLKGSLADHNLDQAWNESQLNQTNNMPFANYGIYPELTLKLLDIALG